MHGTNASPRRRQIHIIIRLTTLRVPWQSAQVDVIKIPKQIPYNRLGDTGIRLCSWHKKSRTMNDVRPGIGFALDSISTGLPHSDMLYRNPWSAPLGGQQRVEQPTSTPRHATEKNTPVFDKKRVEEGTAPVAPSRKHYTHPTDHDLGHIDHIYSRSYTCHGILSRVFEVQSADATQSKTLLIYNSDHRASGQHDLKAMRIM